MSSNSIILLSCLNNVLLEPMIKECLAKGIAIEAVLIDGELSQKDQQNVLKRLEPGYRIKPLSEMNFPGVIFKFVKDHNSAETISVIKSMKSDYLINAGTPRILKKEILNAKVGVLNCHPGILPKYRGCTCVEWAIYNNDPVGATVHFMSEGIDEGPIVMTAAMDVNSGDTYQKIRTRMIGFMAQLMAKGIKEAYARKLNPATMTPQGEGSYFKPIPDDKMQEVLKKLQTTT